jgi:hypothetical protein
MISCQLCPNHLFFCHKWYELFFIHLFPFLIKEWTGCWFTYSKRLCNLNLVLFITIFTIYSISNVYVHTSVVPGGMEYLCLLYIEGAGFVLATHFWYATDVLLSHIVGDRKGVVFGGLVEAPLQPITKRKYQVRYPCCCWFLDAYFTLH